MTLHGVPGILRSVLYLLKLRRPVSRLHQEEPRLLVLSIVGISPTRWTDLIHEYCSTEFETWYLMKQSSNPGHPRVRCDNENERDMKQRNLDRELVSPLIRESEDVETSQHSTTQSVTKRRRFDQ